MKRNPWVWLFAVSLLVNIGLVAAPLLARWQTDGASERALFGMGHQAVPDHLGLDAAQRAHWHAMEEDFVRELHDSGRQIQQHRERMVRELMSERPDSAAIERERETIFSLQERQQRSVIEQLLRERELLRPDQRAALARLLLAQDTGLHPNP